MATNEGEGPETKRRKAFTKKETLLRLEELEDNVSKAVGVYFAMLLNYFLAASLLIHLSLNVSSCSVGEMVSDLSPFDVTDTM